MISANGVEKIYEIKLTEDENALLRKRSPA